MLAQVVRYLHPDVDLSKDVHVVSENGVERIAHWSDSLGPQPMQETLDATAASAEFQAWTWKGRHRQWARDLITQHLGDAEDQRNLLMESAVHSRAEGRGRANAAQVARLDLLEQWAQWVSAVRAESNLAETEQREPVAPPLPPPLA